MQRNAEAASSKSSLTSPESIETFNHISDFLSEQTTDNIQLNIMDYFQLAAEALKSLDFPKALRLYNHINVLNEEFHVIDGIPPSLEVVMRSLQYGQFEKTVIHYRPPVDLINRPEYLAFMAAELASLPDQHLHAILAQLEVTQILLLVNLFIDNSDINNEKRLLDFVNRENKLTTSQSTYKLRLEQDQSNSKINNDEAEKYAKFATSYLLQKDYIHAMISQMSAVYYFAQQKQKVDAHAQSLLILIESKKANKFIPTLEYYVPTNIVFSDMTSRQTTLLSPAQSLGNLSQDLLSLLNDDEKEKFLNKLTPNQCRDIGLSWRSNTLTRLLVTLPNSFGAIDLYVFIILKEQSKKDVNPILIADLALKCADTYINIGDLNNTLAWYAIGLRFNPQVPLNSDVNFRNKLSKHLLTYSKKAIFDHIKIYKPHLRLTLLKQCQNPETVLGSVMKNNIHTNTFTHLFTFNQNKNIQHKIAEEIVKAQHEWDLAKNITKVRYQEPSVTDAAKSPESMIDMHNHF